jgi:hypothetical protein
MKASHLQRPDRNVRRRLWGHWKARVRLKRCLRGGQKGKREEGPRHQIFIYAESGLQKLRCLGAGHESNTFREASRRMFCNRCVTP